MADHTSSFPKIPGIALVMRVGVLHRFTSFDAACLVSHAHPSPYHYHADPHAPLSVSYLGSSAYIEPVPSINRVKIYFQDQSPLDKVPYINHALSGDEKPFFLRQTRVHVGYDTHKQQHLMALTAQADDDVKSVITIFMRNMDDFAPTQHARTLLQHGLAEQSIDTMPVSHIHNPMIQHIVAVKATIPHLKKLMP